MKQHHRLIMEPLMVSEEPRQKGSDSDEPNDIVVDRCNRPDPGEKEPPYEEIGSAEQNDQGQPVGQRFREAEQAPSAGLVQKDIVPEQEEGSHDQENMEDGGGNG